MANGTAKRYTLSVHDMSRNKLCELYDSKIQTEGEPYDIEHDDPIDGLKSITFTLPRMVNGEPNWRANYMTNDFLLRWGEDGVYDWFVIDEPEDSHVGRNDVINVTANHIASLLNRKNLYGSFDDTNGIDTIGNLITKALSGTDWSLGTCETFYEADGTTEKIRSYTCNEKTGAYSMVAGICELFVAYPVFNGDDKTVDIHALSTHDGMMEVVFGKNLDSIVRKRTSTELITRLYVEGDYDQDAYVGIDDVNPTGLPFIMNFDFYRETGQFTQTHEAALNTYLSTMQSTTAAIHTASAAEETANGQLNGIWGASDYVLYTVRQGTATYAMKSRGATEEDIPLEVGDVVAAVHEIGRYTYITIDGTTPFESGIRWAVKFLGPVAGTLGAREVAVDAKTTTVSTLTEEINEAHANGEEIKENSLTEERTAQQASITAMNLERRAQMLEAISLATAIGGYISTITTQQQLQTDAEAAFQAAMGDMLKDGAWNDKNYVAGQEESLYVDSLAVLAEMSRPQYDYTISIMDLATLAGHEGEDFHKNQKIRIYDEVTGINDIAYVSDKKTHPRLENTNVITISTDETGVALKHFDTLISHIMTQADIIKANQGIYDRAKAISQDGTLPADDIDGEIDLLQNKLGSTASGIYTDDRGNLIIEAADGSSAMMLTGAGFMVAAGKDDDGNWKWRTFGTGEGFTADVITAGIIRAGVITILGSDQFYWDDENIYIYEPGTNKQRQIRIGKYDGTNYGIGFTQDGGTTWQNAISFDGVTLSANNISLVVGAAADVIGGTNLVPNTGWYTQTSINDWTISDDSAILFYPANTTDATMKSRIDTYFDGNGVIHWNGVGSTAATITSSKFSVQSGQDYTLSFRFGGSQVTAIILGYDSSGTQTWSQSSVHNSSSSTGQVYTDRATTFTVPSDVVKLAVRFSVQGTGSGTLGRVKVEKGDTATVWSAAPSDPATEVVSRDGTSIIMTEDLVQINGPTVVINVSGEAGDAVWDENGMQIDVIDSPSVANCYYGPASITINKDSSDGRSVFRSLVDAFEQLSNRCLPTNITITFATDDPAAGNALLRGVWGGSTLTINMGGHTFSNGRIAFQSCGIRIILRNGTVSADTNGGLVRADTVMRLNMLNMIMRGADGGSNEAGLYAYTSNVLLSNCEYYSMQYAIWAKDCSTISSQNGTGNVTRVYRAQTATYIGTSGTTPAYNTAYSASNIDSTSTLVGTIPSSGSGGTEPSAPTAVTTVTVTGVATGTYQASGSGWLNAPNTMQGGTLAGLTHYAVIYFDPTSWSGKTIIAASITLRRLTGGSGGSINVRLGTTAVTPRTSGSSPVPTILTDYGIIGMINANRTETFSLPPAALQEIATGGTATSLVIYDTEPQSSKYDYSPNYGMYAGQGDATYKPVLTVTYQA